MEDINPPDSENERTESSKVQVISPNNNLSVILSLPQVPPQEESSICNPKLPANSSKTEKSPKTEQLSVELPSKISEKSLVKSPLIIPLEPTTEESAKPDLHSVDAPKTEVNEIPAIPQSVSVPHFETKIIPSEEYKDRKRTLLVGTVSASWNGSVKKLFTGIDDFTDLAKPEKEPESQDNNIEGVPPVPEPEVEPNHNSVVSAVTDQKETQDGSSVFKIPRKPEFQKKIVRPKPQTPKEVIPAKRFQKPEYLPEIKFTTVKSVKPTEGKRVSRAKAKEEVERCEALLKFAKTSRVIEKKKVKAVKGSNTRNTRGNSNLKTKKNNIKMNINTSSAVTFPDAMRRMSLSEDMEVEVNGNSNASLATVSNGSAPVNGNMNGNSNGLLGKKENPDNPEVLTDALGQWILAQPPPPIFCTNGKSACTELGLPTFPCKRCHREFYCSDEHRTKAFQKHQAECKTESILEVIAGEEEYSIWMKYSASALYDICLNFVLVWPSLTVQWLPEIKELENEVLRHQVILGTQTTGEMNHLLICAIDIPSKPESGKLNLPARHKASQYVLKRINHEGEIHRARYMPSDSSIIATKSPSKDVYVFKLNDYPEIPVDDIFRPSLRLRGHTKEGFGLDWNPIAPGRLLSGSTDNVVCLWDINANPKQDGTESVINALATLKSHTDVVEDVAWHHDQENVCASVGDDAKLVIWDLRVNGNYKSVHEVVNAHGGDINAVSFSSLSDFALATASSDKTVGVWDMRNMKQSLYSLVFHKDEVMQLEWSPHNSMFLASTGKDRRVFFWDLEKISNVADNVSISSADSMDSSKNEAPKELVFIHGGHVSTINDISWNCHEKNMIASVAEDNVFQVWKLNENLLKEECSDGEDEDQQMSQGSSASSEDLI